MSERQCPECEGKGGFEHWYCDDDYDWHTCDTCNGRQVLTAAELMQYYAAKEKVA